MIVGLAFHILAALVWVGGMFFAHVMLRPSAGPLEPAIRFALWQRVFARFFVWVWLAILVLLVSGVAMIQLALGGFAAVGPGVNLMLALGVVMMLLFAHVYFAPYRRFRSAVAAADWPLAETTIGQIRRLVLINLVLGVVTAVAGAASPYWI